MLVFISHPIQYVSPLLKGLSDRIRLKVYYYGGQSAVNDDKGFGQFVSWDVPLTEGYDHEFLINLSKSAGMNTQFFDAMNWSIFKILRKSKDKVVFVNGWAYMSDWFVLLGSALYGKKVWMRAEMPWNQEGLKPKSIKRKIKYIVFKYIVFKYLIDKYLYIGTQNKNYYLFHDVDESRLVHAPYAVDNFRFINSKTDGSIAREKWAILRDKAVVLYSGKLISKKRPLDLLKAFHLLNSSNAVLFYMGDGPLRSDIEEFVSAHAMNNVIISGFINQTEIGMIYSMADLFVMCSGIGETWGLSVNEAMNFDLPVIISSTCGCSVDLVNEGENGFIYQEGDISELSRHLTDLIQNENMRKQMGEKSGEKIVNFSHQITIENIAQALESA